MYSDDLKMIRKAGYRVDVSLWKLVPVEIIERTAFLVCETPENQPGEIVDWAIDKIKWVRYDYGTGAPT